MISVITVTYNCSLTIEKTIKSVLNQKNIDVEYIIVDGKSTDGTIEIINRYNNHLSHCVSEPDNGIYFAMNKAISLAEGDYLYFLNGDDSFCDDYALARINKYLNAKKIVIGQVYYGSRLSCKPSENIKSPYFNVFYPHQGMFIPRDLFEKYGKYDTNYRISADFEWICRVIHSGEELEWVEEPISYYRIGGRSESVQRVIDEYNISRKYLLLEKQDYLLAEMESNTVENLKNIMLCEVLKNSKYDALFKHMVCGFINSDMKVSLWGAGHLSSLFIVALERCGITIERIIDKNPTRTDVDGIPICGYKKEYIDNLIISTEAYDDEISHFLLNEGFVDGKEFFSHRFMRNEIIRCLPNDDEMISNIYNRCGIRIVDTMF